MSAVDVIVSEWLKVRSLRSSWYLAAATVAVLVAAAGLALLMVREFDTLTPREQASADSANAVSIIGVFAPYVIGCIAVLTITGEYATRMIIPSLVAVPQRRLIFTGKVTVVTAVALAIGSVITFSGLLVTRLIVGGRPEPINPWPTLGDAVAQSLGVTVSIVVIALVALAFGTIIRASAGALVTLAIVLYLLPSLVTLIPGEWGMWSASVMLLNLGSQLSGQSGGPLPPVGAGAAMAGYIALACGGSYLALRRDA
jgi:ABC-2 type transport system permease protein